MKRKLARISKQLSYVLRHKPESIGITLDNEGWVAVTTLLAALATAGTGISEQLLRQVVRDNDKRRFALSADGRMIRANQGHSTKVDLALPQRTPPEVLFHGSARKNITAIRAQGLNRGARHHVHLSVNAAAARKVGTRHGKPVVLSVFARAMHDAGHRFYCSDNGVWLTRAVPPGYLQIGDDGNPHGPHEPGDNS